MSGTQFLSILRECRGAPRSKTRISFLYYIGSFAVWRGVEYGLVRAISACTGRVRRQFENCGYRRQYSKSAYAPLCRRSCRRFYTCFSLSTLPGRRPLEVGRNMADDDEERKYVHSLLGEGSKLPLKVGGGGRTWSFKRQVSKSKRLTHPPSLRMSAGYLFCGKCTCSGGAGLCSAPYSAAE